MKIATSIKASFLYEQPTSSCLDSDELPTSTVFLLCNSDVDSSISEYNLSLQGTGVYQSVQSEEDCTRTCRTVEFILT